MALLQKAADINHNLVHSLLCKWHRNFGGVDYPSSLPSKTAILQCCSTCTCLVFTLKYCILTFYLYLNLFVLRNLNTKSVVSGVGVITCRGILSIGLFITNKFWKCWACMYSLYELYYAKHLRTRWVHCTLCLHQSLSALGPFIIILFCLR